MWPDYSVSVQNQLTFNEENNKQQPEITQSSDEDNLERKTRTRYSNPLHLMKSNKLTSDLFQIETSSFNFFRHLPDENQWFIYNWNIEPTEKGS